MPNFQVPQFIERKPKIIGPLTLPQFLYVAAAVALSLLCYYIFNFLLWLTISVAALSVALALAFFKVNGQDMPKIMQAAIGYMLHPRIYTWQRAFAEKTLEVGDLEQIENLRKGAGLEEKLKSIALSIATGKLFSAKDERLTGEKEKYQAVTFLTGERRLAKRIDYTDNAKIKNQNGK